MIAQQVNAQTTHRIQARWCKSIKTYHRLKKCDRIFDIDAIRNVDEENRVMEIDAIERDPER